MPISTIYRLCDKEAFCVVEQGKENGKVGWWFRKQKDVKTLIFISEDEIEAKLEKTEKK